MSKGNDARRKQREREASAAKRAAGIRYMGERMNLEVLEQRLREIPADTRNLTARIFGDPVFERSALYRKQNGSEA